jgi:molybdopterin synthase catalytic subunit
MARIETSISERPLDVAGTIESTMTPGAGGLGIFVGTVRLTAAVEDNSDKIVTALDYEAHPELADARMREIAEETVGRYGLLAISAHHRCGYCPLGEPTVVVVCAAAHRAEALEACRFAIDTIKSTVPIWKKEVYSDGSAWVGTGS